MLAPTLPPRQQALVAVGAGADIDSTLKDALEQARAGDTLELAGQEPGRARSKVVIRPVLAPQTPRQDPPLTYADPRLVEALEEWLRTQGWSDVTIAVPGPGGHETAATVGYRSDVLDLTSDVEPFHYGGLIGEHPIAKAWLQADVRILIGKARTDRQLLFAGAIIGALGCLPDSDELARRFRSAHDIAECASDILEKLPVAFGLIDAWHGADGAGPPAGRGDARDTRAVLASGDLLALDWVLGELMDLEAPELNPVVREALHRRGPIEVERRGDLSEWDPWRNPGALRAVFSDLGAGRWWGAITGSQEVPWTAR